jgi:uncharacterized protein HemX
MDLLAALVIGAACWLWTARSARGGLRTQRSAPGKLALTAVGFPARPPASPVAPAHVAPKPRLEPKPKVERAASNAPRAPAPRARVPITLGVALVLQLVGLLLTALVGGLLVLRSNLDAREAQNLAELRASQRVQRAQAASERAQAELREANEALRALSGDVSRVQERLHQLEQQYQALDRAARVAARTRKVR